MKYYGFLLETNEEKIKAAGKIRRSDFCCDNGIATVNAYVQRNTPSSLSFFIHDVEGDIAHAVFAFDEQKHTLESAHAEICGMVKDACNAGLSKAEPYEITMYRFKELFMEAKRHEYIQSSSMRIAEAAHLWNYYLNADDERALPFTMEERIASCGRNDLEIYDKTYAGELANINANKLDAYNDVNMAHYIISGNSRGAEYDLAELLVNNLYGAKRLSSRRIVYLSEIKPNFFERDHHIDDLIENSYGGTVVIDLSERFGYSASDYIAACEYLKKLFRKNCNKCLFVFTYNREDPGYSYYILPEISKLVFFVNLREGKGSRKAAVAYLKTLIKKTEYGKYAKDANAFFKDFAGDEFSQTDVLEAFERFEPWCINKNMSGIYTCDPSKEYMSDREESVSSLEKLNSLIGLEIVKEQINSILASDIVEKERKKHSGSSYKSISTHMVFAGNPGSAKTTVAKLFAGIAKEKGVLKSGVFVERGGMDLDTMLPQCAVREAFVAAKGGVLFIDEAYAMRSQTAISVLIQEMENNRDDVIVILAGYDQRMRNFLELNEGLKSRVPHWVDFPDYTTDELTQIFLYMLSERGLTASDDAVMAARLLFDRNRLLENFGNGRFVRNLIDKALLNQSGRLMSEYPDGAGIPKDELYNLTAADITGLHEGLKDVREHGEAMAELTAMVGLESAKEVISKAIAKFKLDKLCMDRGIQRDRGSMHMVFTGNPGTAKTTVARLCAEILSDEKILTTGSFVEVGRADLVGAHVGETAQIVKKRFREAQGGVLFIDEAYSLCDSLKGGYGDEAINTIVQEMENHREDTLVIFAGYPDPMKEFLDRNPGMKSRIAFHVTFKDYTTDELCKITELMASKKNIAITEKAMDKLRSDFESARVNDDYGNGRYVRKLLEEAEMNLANRVVQMPENELTAEIITTIEACDIPDFKPDGRTKRRIGFAS